MANLFNKAKAVTTTAAKAKKSNKAEHQIEGLLKLAELDALMKSAAALKASLEAEVKAQALEIFISEADGKRPESFRGVDGIASASMECRKRGTNSALSADEVELLASYGIQAEKLEITKQLFAINPNYAGDDSLLEKVSAALEGVVPDDFIVVQEEKSKYVVNDKAIDDAFAKKCPVEVIQAVTTLAVKPKLEVTNIAQIMDDLRDVVSAYAPDADARAA